MCKVHHGGAFFVSSDLRAPRETRACITCRLKEVFRIRYANERGDMSREGLEIYFF